MALAEKAHNGFVFLVETVLHLIKLADVLVVEVTLTVALEQGHRQLVHGIVIPLLASGHVCLQVFHKTLGRHVGTFVKGLDLVAAHLDLHVTVNDGETRLVLLAQLSLLTHDGVESLGLPLDPVAELTDILHQRQ